MEQFCNEACWKIRVVRIIGMYWLGTASQAQRGVALWMSPSIWHSGGQVPDLAVRKEPGSVTIRLMTVENGLSDRRGV